MLQNNSSTLVQNNSNTLVQNNIQSTNSVNLNNASSDSRQSLLVSQSSVAHLSQTSSSTVITTTTTTTSPNSIVNDSLPSNTRSILPPISSSEQQHQTPIRLKSALMGQHQELVPVIQKMRIEDYETMNRQLSSTNSDATNLTDNESNGSKHKYQRPIRSESLSKKKSLKVNIKKIVLI